MTMAEQENISRSIVVEPVPWEPHQAAFQIPKIQKSLSGVKKMKLKNVLIAVKDTERARRFYHDLFGLELVQDNDGNMILTDGLVLQDEKIWRRFLGKDIIPA